jgi:hypothetical protein
VREIMPISMDQSTELALQIKKLFLKRSRFQHREKLTSSRQPFDVEGVDELFAFTNKQGAECEFLVAIRQAFIDRCYVKWPNGDNSLE